VMFAICQSTEWLVCEADSSAGAFAGGLRTEKIPSGLKAGQGLHLSVRYIHLQSGQYPKRWA